MSEIPKKVSDLARTIATAREKRGMNQSELARAVGVSPQAVQKWEAGASVPRANKLKAIAEVLGISIREIVPTRATPGTSSRRRRTSPTKWLT